MRGHDDSDRAIDGGYLLDRHHVIDISESCAAQFVRDQHAQQPHPSKLLYDGRRKLARLVPLHDMRCDFLGGKGAYLSAQLLLLLGQAEGVGGCVGEGGCTHW